jgi:carboxyl-terminal processing protease
MGNQAFHFKHRIGFWLKLLFTLLLVAGLVLGWAVAPAYALTSEQKLFNEAWRIVSQSYVDETFNGQNWWLLRQKTLQSPLPDRAATYKAIQQMLTTLNDPFTRLLQPAQYRSLQTSTNGELTGIGLQITLDADTSHLEVITPIPGSPAAKAGILPKDQILQIDDIVASHLSLDEAAEKMRGPVGSTVQLLIRHGQTADSDPPLVVKVVRDRIELNPVVAELRSFTGSTTGAAAGSTATAVNISASAEGGKFGYIRLNQFNANATQEMKQAIQRLEKQGANAYVLDLRGNPGGLLQAGVDIAELWMEPGPIVYTVDRHGVMDSLTAERPPLTRAPLVVLVNRGTASASEILAGALQDSERATLVGERTFGKGLIQSLFSLADDSGLAVTVARYQTPDHHDINKVGIEPDLVVPLNRIQPDQLGTSADTQYQAAVAQLHSPPVLADAA